MELYKAEGIVLRARDFGEADKILTIYTKEWGKVQAIAKGVRKTKSKNRGAVQLFSYSSFLIYRGKSLDTVTQCQSIEAFGILRENLQRMAYASYLIELTDRLIVEKEKNENIFLLLLTTLHLLEQGELSTISGMYIMRLLNQLGYKPYFEGCVNCGQDYSINSTYRLSPLLGGIICSSCFNEDYKAIKINHGSIAIFKQFLLMDIRKLHLLKINQSMQQEINHSLKMYIQNYLDYPLKSQDFLDEILKKYLD